MIKTGIVSVTFRELNPTQIVDVTKKAGLESIEWGGDVHVPHGDINIAKEVAYITKQAGLEIASYGSYYELVKDNDFDNVLSSAIELGVYNIRVWAGEVGTENADENHWQNIIKESQRICDLAKKENINISYEYHNGSLTDTLEGTVRLLDSVNRDNVFTYFQPPDKASIKENIESIEKLTPKISNIHIQQCIGNTREELRKGIDVWKKYFKHIRKDNKDRYALIEFVKEDKATQLIEDAKALREILGI